MSSRIVEFSKKLNPLVSAILRSPLHRLLSRGLVLVTVTGRRTGRRYTIPTGYLVDGDVVIILVADAPDKLWWRNYRAPGPIELRLRGRRVPGTGEVVEPGTEEFRRRAEACFGRARFIGRLFGIEFNPSTGLRDEQVEQFRSCGAMVRVTPGDPGPLGSTSQ